MRRKTTTRTLAQIPISAKVGIAPSNVVGITIATTEVTSTSFRPTISPRYPKTAAPKGRIRNPAAKVPKVAIKATDLFSLGKNSCEMTTAMYP